MNAKKLGMVAAAALTALAAQANAKEAKKAKAAPAKDAMVCMNSCGSDPANAKGGCAGKVEKKEHTTKEACEKASGKWMAKAPAKDAHAHDHDHK